MIVSKTFEAVCRGCKNKITLREYEGLEGGIYGDHHCPEILEAMLNHTSRWKLYDKFKEIK